MVHGFASPLNVPAPPDGFETAWARFLPEMLESYKDQPEIGMLEHGCKGTAKIFFECGVLSRGNTLVQQPLANPNMQESQLQQNAPSFAESPESYYGAVDTSSTSSA